MSIIQQTIGWLALFLFGGLVGALATSFFISIETVIETVEIEKPIITEKIVEVEVIKEVEVYRFIDEYNPVHKWIDPDNQAVVYIYPKGYTGEIWPMYSLVPPETKPKVNMDTATRTINDLSPSIIYTPF